jgi:hypothetical protein
MMTSIKTDHQKEIQRKKRLLTLNIEVFGKETADSEARNTFIEVLYYTVL